MSANSESVLSVMMGHESDALYPELEHMLSLPPNDNCSPGGLSWQQVTSYGDRRFRDVTGVAAAAAASEVAVPVVVSTSC